MCGENDGCLEYLQAKHMFFTNWRPGERADKMTDTFSRSAFRKLVFAPRIIVSTSSIARCVIETIFNVERIPSLGRVPARLSQIVWPIACAPGTHNTVEVFRRKMARLVRRTSAECKKDLRLGHCPMSCELRRAHRQKFDDVRLTQWWWVGAARSIGF